MPQRDGYSNFGFLQAAPAQEKVAVTGETIDVRDYDTATMIVNIGLVGGAVGSLGTTNIDLILQHALSDASGSIIWSYVPASMMIHSVIKPNGSGLSGVFQNLASVTDGSAMYFVGYKGNYRYLRVAIATHTGAPTVSALHAGATCLLGKPAHWPVNAPADSDYQD